jgi:hypothetical protein
MMRAPAALLSVIGLTAVLGCHWQSDRNPAAPTAVPALTAVTPAQASVGDPIALTGSAFTASNNSIRIGPGYLHGMASSGGTSLTFTLPSALSPCPPWAQVCITLAVLVTPGTYQVAVVNANGTSNELPLQVVAR